jgi:hypothetical protein
LEYKLKEKAKAGELKVVNRENGTTDKKKRRWDQTQTPVANENEQEEVSI